MYCCFIVCSRDAPQSTSTASESSSLSATTGLHARTSPGLVRRKFLVLEQQANIMRLKKELDDAQRELSSLNQSAYQANNSTSYI